MNTSVSQGGLITRLLSPWKSKNSQQRSICTRLSPPFWVPAQLARPCPAISSDLAVPEGLTSGQSLSGRASILQVAESVSRPPAYLEKSWKFQFSIFNYRAFLRQEIKMGRNFIIKLQLGLKHGDLTELTKNIIRDPRNHIFYVPRKAAFLKSLIFLSFTGRIKPIIFSGKGREIIKYKWL